MRTIQIAAILCFLFSQSACRSPVAHGPIRISKATLKAVDIMPSLEILRDESSPQTIAEVLKRDRDFVPVETYADLRKQDIYRGKWLKFKVHFAEETKRRFFVGSLQANFSTMDFWRYDGKEAKLIGRYGYDVPFDEKHRHRRLGFFPIDSQGATELTYYVYFKSDYLARTDLWLFDNPSVYFHDTVGTIVLAFAAGGFFVLACYHLFLFAFFRDTAYVYYALFIGGMLVSDATTSGFTEMIGLRTFGHSWIFYGRYFNYCLPIFALFYTRTFLLLSATHPRFDHWCRVWTGVVAALWLTVLCGTNWFVDLLGEPFDLITIATVIAAGVMRYRAGFHPARFFLVAWAIFGSAVVVWTLAKMGVFVLDQMILLTPYLGSLGEAIFMALALGARISLIEQRRVTAEVGAKEGQRAQHLLRVLSHDINNALTVILSCGTIGKQLTSDLKLKEIFTKIIRAGDSIANISANVRRLDAVRSGKMSLELEPVSLREVFEEVRFIFSEPLQKKALTLVEYWEGNDLVVMAEKSSLSSEVISNIISNAIKFSHKGEMIAFSAKPEGHEVVITIKDNGVGIPQELLAVLFESHRSTSRIGTEREIGTGFGLPTVKMFVEQYGGTISVASQENQGTTFTIRLRQAEAKAHKNDLAS